MMDETDEEALFTRLRTRLAAGPLAGGHVPLATAIARLEATIEARVEAVVARRTAGLRADIDDLAERLAKPRGRGLAQQPWRVAALVLAMAVLAGSGAAAVWFGGDSLGTGFAGWRTNLVGPAG
ncbi:MAG TPA: hypothetical protein VJ779_15335 [Acetobacteraceae bacterium]|nr:hypothetical protein [Acetobacteraceae bacterium]